VAPLLTYVRVRGGGQLEKTKIKMPSFPVLYTEHRPERQASRGLNG